MSTRPSHVLATYQPLLSLPNFCASASSNSYVGGQLEESGKLVVIDDRRTTCHWILVFPSTVDSVSSTTVGASLCGVEQGGPDFLGQDFRVSTRSQQTETWAPKRERFTGQDWSFLNPDDAQTGWRYSRMVNQRSLSTVAKVSSQ